MILKTLTHDRGGSDCWNYYSGVSSASVFYNEKLGSHCVAITGNNIEGETIISISDQAYLCTDNGQTIEKIGRIRNEKQNEKV